MMIENNREDSDLGWLTYANLIFRPSHIFIAKSMYIIIMCVLFLLKHNLAIFFLFCFTEICQCPYLQFKTAILFFKVFDTLRKQIRG